MKITHLPFDGEFKVTWPYGAQANFAGTPDNKHHGIDLVGVTSKDVYATIDGVVNFAGFDPSGFGNYVKIVEDATGLAHYYAHLESINVKVGQRVSYTTKLGVMGATGNVTGPHTHYEIRRNGVHIDPTPYMGIPNANGTYSAKNYLVDVNVPGAKAKPVQSNIIKYKVTAPRGLNLRKDHTTLSSDMGGVACGTILNIVETFQGQSYFWGKTDKGFWCALSAGAIRI